MIRKLKVGQLARILTNKGTISREEYFSFILIDYLSRIPYEQRYNELSKKMHFGVDYIKRAVTKLLYQPGFLDRIEFDYYNNILPYSKKHSLISLLRTK